MSEKGLIEQVWSEYLDAIEFGDELDIQALKKMLINAVEVAIGNMQRKYLDEMGDPNESAEVKAVSNIQLCECAAIIKLLTGRNAIEPFIPK